MRSFVTFVVILAGQLLVGAATLMLLDGWSPETTDGWIALAIFGWFTGFAIFAVGCLLYGVFALRKLALPAFSWRRRGS